MKKVKIYTNNDCSHCEELKQYLTAQTIDFEEINLSKNKKAAELLFKKTGYYVVPQTKIDDQYIIGFDRVKINELMKN